MLAPIPETVERARAGDRDAFEALVRAGSNRLYAVAYRILHDADAAQDALQAALIAIWDDLPSLRDPARYDAWCYRLICRACYREAGRRRRRALPELPEGRPADGPDLAVAVADRDEMARGFAKLTPERRAVLVLHYYVGLTIGEVAAVLGVSPGTAGSRLHYALQDLHAALDAEARAVPAWERSV